MSRIPPALARRVDRLARRAHDFHRYAHHPLCSRYAAEVIRLGRRTRICLGCTLTGLGALAGAALGLAVPAAPPSALNAAGAFLVVAVPLVVRRRPAHTDPLPRLLPGKKATGTLLRARKLLTRFLPAALGALTIAQAVRAPSAARLCAAAMAAAAVGWLVVRYRGRGPDRSHCDGCPEGPPSSRCSGLAPIARRERALSRLAGRWIAAAGTGAPPPCDP